MVSPPPNVNIPPSILFFNVQIFGKPSQVERGAMRRDYDYAKCGPTQADGAF